MVRFHHVMQTEPGLCMAACCAMLTGESIERVIEEAKPLQPQDGPRYLPTNRAIAFLSSRMIGYGLVIAKIEELSDDTEAFQITVPLTAWAILTVPSPNFKEALHVVVWNPQTRRIHDPLHKEPRRLSEYKVIEWAPVYDVDQTPITRVV